MTSEMRNRVLSPETLIPVGVLMVLLGPLIAGTWMASAMFSEFKTRLASLEAAVGRSSDRWTLKMERQSWQEFVRNNPNVKAPDVKQIHQDFTE